MNTRCVSLVVHVTFLGMSTVGQTTIITVIICDALTLWSPSQHPRADPGPHTAAEPRGVGGVLGGRRPPEAHPVGVWSAATAATATQRTTHHTKKQAYKKHTLIC